MKVLMINVVCGIRSTGRICTDLASALEAQGHEVIIAYGRENVPKQFQKYSMKIGSDLDVKLHGVKARVFDESGFGSKAATEKFIKWVKEYDPDVIHLHNIHGYYINVEVLFEYLKTCGKKIIWTLHDCWSFTGHSVYCDTINCKRWVNGCHDCPQIKTYPQAFIDRSRKNWKRKKKIFSSVPNMTIVTPSKWLGQFVKHSFLSEYPVMVIYNGIDTCQFRPLPNNFKQTHGIEDKFMILGVATSWDDMKGFSDYLALADKLGDEYKVVLVGLTEEQIKKLPSNVLGIKRTASVEKLACIYSAADLFANLSYCENYPMVNLEARACGTPVITYKTGGSPESAGEDSIVVERGNVQELLEKIKAFKTADIKAQADVKVDDNSQTVSSYLNLYNISDENAV